MILGDGIICQDFNWAEFAELGSSPHPWKLPKLWMQREDCLGTPSRLAMLEGLTHNPLCTEQRLGNCAGEQVT